MQTSLGIAGEFGAIFKSVGLLNILGYTMSVVEIDERGRMTIPKKIGIKKTRAIVIPAGSFFITIPLPENPQKEAGGRLNTTKERKELKVEAEKLAREDAVNRAKRRNQL